MFRGLSKKELITEYKIVLENLSRITDDYLFLLDIEENTNVFFGSAYENFAIAEKDAGLSTLDDMLKIVHPADKPALTAEFEEIISGKKDIHNMQYRWIDRKGKSVRISSRGNIVKNSDGKPLLMIGRISESAVKHLYNPTTGCYNLTKLMCDLKQELPCKKHNYIMILKINDFAAINLTHGRLYRDSLVRKLAEALESFSSSENVYHVERNLFAICLDVPTEQEILTIFDKLSKLLNSQCTITAGAAPMDNNIFADENELYDAVKVVEKRAKSNGNNSIEFFAAEEMHKKIMSIELLEELQASVDNGFKGFHLVYQPQVKAGSYDLYSAEALLRYDSPSGRKVFPDEFIPLLEQSKLIIPVGMWVLETALTECKKWRKTFKNMHMNVNFSMVQFRNKGIIKDILDVLEKTDMPGDALTVEITESFSAHEATYCTEIISQLKEYGIQFAMDDFGTGYSNIGCLKEFDIDEIKIDRLFVKDIEENTYNFKLLSNTLEFAKSNAIRVCCEGVETPRELAILETRSPNLMQGYLFDKPCDPDVFAETYINEDTDKFKKRLEYINMLYHYKDQMSTIKFDPKDILRESDMGLWIVRVNQAENTYELHCDETMERIMGMEKKYSPQECYNFWFSRIHNDSLERIKTAFHQMCESANPVEMQYSWSHPILGDVTVRSTGKRTQDINGMTVIEGYHRILSN